MAYLSDQIAALQEIIHSSNESQRLNNEKMQRSKHHQQYELAYSSDQTNIGNPIKHANSAMQMSNIPDNLINEAPTSATNSHDGEFLLSSGLNKDGFVTNNNATSMPTVLAEPNETITYDHNHNPSLQQDVIEELKPYSQLEEEPIVPVFNVGSQYFDAELQTICDELEKAR